MPDEHVHEWKLTFHLDGCHAFASHYKCECGAARVSSAERDFEGYGAVWALEGCERCDELLAGAKPKSSDEIFLPAAGGAGHVPA